MGFLILQEIQATEQSLLNVDRVQGHFDDPLLTGLGALLIQQQGMVKNLGADVFECHNQETAEAIATLVERSRTVIEDKFSICQIIIVDEIGTEGWAALRRAAEQLSAEFGKEIYLDSGRKQMIAGRREDLKAIWANVFTWLVWDDINSYEGKG